MNDVLTHAAVAAGAADFAPEREDLAAALRWAAHLGLNEGVCNHFRTLKSTPIVI